MTPDGVPDKKALVGQFERAKKMLEERRYRDQRLLDLLDELRHGAQARSVALAERRHDYWDELAHVTMPLRTTLGSYKDGEFDGEPTHTLTEQIHAFVGAGEDAAKAGR
jgi:hypothetical protein